MTTSTSRSDNIPFFAKQATVGDVIRARREDGRLVFDGIISRSNHSLIRVIFFDADRIPTVRRQLVELGCSSELFGSHDMIAVDIPGETALAPVQAYLFDLEQQELVSYEEPILRHAD